MKLSNLKWDDRYGYDYFERGPQTYSSLYENYRWMPELTIPMACKLSKMYPNMSILDFGCAKGFLVHALNLVGVEAYGFDISKYAIKHAPEAASKFLYGPDTADMMPDIDMIFAKDVFEHIGYLKISEILKTLAKLCTHALFIVPFGKNGRYRIKQYNMDPTHTIIENESWWSNQFTNAGFKIADFSYHIEGFKDNWKNYKNGNGFFRLWKFK